MRQIVWFIALGCLSYLVDISTADGKYKTCMNLQAQGMHLLHHIIYMFVTFGFLATDKTVLKLWLVVVAVHLLHWQTNGDKCAVTQWYNKQCNYSGGIRDMFSVMGWQEISNKLIPDGKRMGQKLVFGLGILFAGYKLLK